MFDDPVAAVCLFVALIGVAVIAVWAFSRCTKDSD